MCLGLIGIGAFAEAGRHSRFQYQQGNCANGQCQAPAFAAPATAPQATTATAKRSRDPVASDYTAPPAKDVYSRDIYTGEVTRKTAAGEVVHLVVLDTDESVPARRKVTEYISRADLLKLSGINVVAGCKCGPNCKCATDQKTAALNPVNPASHAATSASWQMITEHCESTANAPPNADNEVHVVHVPTPEDVVHATVENVESFVSTLRHRDNSDDAAWDAIQVE